MPNQPYNSVGCLKLSSLIGVTISALVWKPGLLISSTLLYIVMMAAYFLTPILHLVRKKSAN